MHARILVSRSALRDNAQRLRDLVAPARIGFAVKANGYGHGIVETALTLEPAASLFCVYGVEEALELREGGVTKPILILGPVAPEDLGNAHDARAAITLWNTKSYVLDVTTVARKRSRPFPVHVKINSGLNRLGLSLSEAADAIEDYTRIAEIQVDGVFSHLACAEELNSAYTLGQLAAFEAAVAPVATQLQRQSQRPSFHIAASAAAMLWPQTRLDLVRIGIAAYGLWPSPQTREAMARSGMRLDPALHYESRIVALRSVGKGEPIGYGGDFRAPEDMRIAIVPVGYADGIPRALSERGAFVVRGMRCAITGRICMNMLMIDVTAVAEARVGDRVTLIGRDNEAGVSAEDWASWAQTINYEIVSRLPAHIPREFTGEAAPA